MEIVGLLIMDTWKTCVTLDFQHALAPDNILFLQPAQGKLCSGSSYFDILLL
jgi:hypothetical protein